MPYIDESLPTTNHTFGSRSGNAKHAVAPQSLPATSVVITAHKAGSAGRVPPPNYEKSAIVRVRYITCNADSYFYAAAGLGFKVGSPSRS